MNRAINYIPPSSTHSLKNSKDVCISLPCVDMWKFPNFAALTGLFLPEFLLQGAPPNNPFQRITPPWVTSSHGSRVPSQASERPPQDTPVGDALRPRAESEDPLRALDTRCYLTTARIRSCRRTREHGLVTEPESCVPASHPYAHSSSESLPAAEGLTGLGSLSAGPAESPLPQTGHSQHLQPGDTAFPAEVTRTSCVDGTL